MTEFMAIVLQFILFATALIIFVGIIIAAVTSIAIVIKVFKEVFKK